MAWVNVLVFKEFTIGKSISIHCVFFTVICYLEATEDAEGLEQLVLNDNQYL